jgi:hypothetical protein
MQMPAAATVIPNCFPQLILFNFHAQVTSHCEVPVMIMFTEKLPPELIIQTKLFIEENKQMGYTTKEEFVRDAIRFRLNWLKSGNECLEVPREQYEMLNEAVREMNLPFRSADQFINSQVDALLEKYEEYKNNALK